jgi:hypothetical protein
MERLVDDVRTVSKREIVGVKPYRCGFCNDVIGPGDRQMFYRGFDPDRSTDGGKTWGAFVTERRHLRCTPEALLAKRA